MSAGGERWRLFLAVPVPPATRDAIAAWTRGWHAAADNWRLVNPAGVHLTLRFYGATDPARAGDLERQVVELAASHADGRLEAAGWGVFPSPSRARVLWAGLRGDVDRLAALAAAAETGARALGYEPEERRFHPHLTLARAGDSGRPRLPGAPDPAVPVFGEVPLDELVLYRSHLGAGGARYEALVRAPLGKPGRA